ncbi:MAG: UDP-N-acetylmuramoyl-L-alanine--D-glutamate ligase [Armatimonadota bacterium]|nr:MAG: UDP-N-acetylmuramoyl-L-alanine--D-glutamate ligase [Armatimonadota bacterium]
MSARRAYVIGLGEYGTGRAVATALASLGISVTAADVKPPEDLADQIEALPQEVTLEAGQEAYRTLLDSDLVVISPGVPPDLPMLQDARERGIEVIGELELAYRLTTARFVAITGTKGKTTTTTLTGRLLADGGIRAHVGGNIGSPIIEHALAAAPDDVLVTEVSSFQLETTRDFRPHIAVLLNFWPDHLDRHVDVAAYWSAKRRIFERQGSDDWAVLNFDEPQVRGLADKIVAQVAPFSRTELLGRGVYVDGEQIVAAPPVAAERHAVAPVVSLRLRGRHNLENALAALAAAGAAGADLSGAERTLSAFEGVPNRLEEVGTVGGVIFINDSQATNPPAVERALEAIEEAVVLIAGGRPKVADFVDLGRAIAAKARALVVIGEAGPAIAAAAQAAGLTDIETASTLPAAVRAAFDKAQPGDVVLLSPACASFDMFRNMAHRGEVFRTAVAELAATAATSRGDQ